MKHLLYLLLILATLLYIHKAEAEEYMVMQYNENVRIVLSKRVKYAIPINKGTIRARDFKKIFNIKT